MHYTRPPLLLNYKYINKQLVSIANNVIKTPTTCIVILRTGNTVCIALNVPNVVNAKKIRLSLNVQYYKAKVFVLKEVCSIGYPLGIQLICNSDFVTLF